MSVIGLYFGGILVIGGICARRTNTADNYFLAGRTMQGWVVGFSLMATTVSSMTFLATPAFSFEHNWRHFPANCTYIAAIVAAIFLFIPFYRRGYIRSAYEYLERRFGLWARLYAAACFILFQTFKMGIVLYVACLPIQTMTGFNLPLIMLIVGVVVALYTIAGGLEAVIWTDVVQGIILIIGGLICIPIVISHLPGGFGQIVSIGIADDKFSIGSKAFTLQERTVWVMLLTTVVTYLQNLGADQMSVQRYCAAKSEKEAKISIIVGGMLTVPVWACFTFIGTALYVFYKILPDPAINQIDPSQVFPYFILTQIPAGVAGFVIAGLFAAAMSTLDSIINAAAATITTDFYRRIVAHNQNELHYARIGKLFSILFSMIMIMSAFVIHYSRSQEALADIQTMLMSILGGGLLSLYLLGFLTTNVDNKSALIAICVTVLGTAGWLCMKSSFGYALCPSISKAMPDNFWVGVFSNLFLFIVGYGVSCVIKKKSIKDLKDLTIWTIEKH